MKKHKYRTQPYLDKAQYLFLKESAARCESIAEVVRTLIDREMGAGEAAPSPQI